MPNLYQTGIIQSTHNYTNTVIPSIYQNGIGRRMGNNIEKYRKLSGLTREELAERLGITATTIYRKERGDRGLKTHELEEYAKALNCSTEDLVSVVDKKIKVIGYVGAGVVYAYDDNPIGEGVEDDVPCPAGLEHKNMIAVRIRGESMRPALRDGWLLFYSKMQDGIPDECINQLCVVCIEGDGMMVRDIKHGSKKGYYHLIAYNGESEFDVKLKWASKVIDIRPR